MSRLMVKPMRKALMPLAMVFFIRTCLSVPSSGTHFEKREFCEMEGGAIQKTAVQDIFQCLWLCENSPECMSLNIAHQPNQDGLHECVLLRNETKSSEEVLRPSQVYHHYSREANSRPRENVTATVSCDVIIPLGMKTRAIPSSSINASSFFDSRYLPDFGRLDMQPNGDNTIRGAWAAKTNNKDEWLQVDLAKTTKVQRIATQGNPAWPEWVTSYTLQYSMIGQYFEDYEGRKTFAANANQHTTVTNDLAPAIITRYIRVLPRRWYKHIAMRVELYGCR